MARRLHQQPAIETHPLREQILEALVKGESPKSISSWVKPYLSAVAIWRYKRKSLVPALQQQREIEKALKQNELMRQKLQHDEEVRNMTAVASTLLAANSIDKRLNAKFERYDDWLAEARKDRDFSTLCTIDSRETEAIRLHAQLTGRLQENPQIGIQIVIGEGPKSQEPAQTCDKPASEQVIDLGPKRYSR